MPVDVLKLHLVTDRQRDALNSRVPFKPGQKVHMHASTPANGAAWFLFGRFD